MLAGDETRKLAPGAGASEEEDGASDEEEEEEEEYPLFRALLSSLIGRNTPRPSALYPLPLPDATLALRFTASSAASGPASLLLRHARAAFSSSRAACSMGVSVKAS